MNSLPPEWLLITKKSNRAIIYYNLVIVCLLLTLELGVMMEDLQGSGGFTVLVLVFLLPIMVIIHSVIFVFVFIKNRVNLGLNSKNLLIWLLKIIGWNVLALWMDGLLWIILLNILDFLGILRFINFYF